MKIINKVLIVVLFVSLIIYSLVPQEKYDTKRAKDLYIKYCSKCHRKNGKGVKLVYPPVRDADYIKNGNVIELLRGIIYGREGRITVNGYTYQGVMTTEVDKTLSDADIVLILNYVMQEMNGMKVQATEEDVKAARRAGKLPVHK